MSAQFVVGKFYMVPCMKVALSARSFWMEANGWVPVLGPKHEDAEHLGFPYPHFHIDWRFVSAACFKRAVRGKQESRVLAKVLTNTTGDSFDHQIVGQPELRRIKCKREMPVFPQAHSIGQKGGLDHGWRWIHMERAQAFTCNKLKPGNICPHRGIDLTSFIKPDGTVICPGHGLKWNTVTGELMPRHGGPI